MGQFAFGLVAGIVVGLVMEWVIDWAGLLPRGSAAKSVPPKRSRGAALSETGPGTDRLASESALESSSTSSIED